MKKIAILGANGFLGRNLYEYFSSKSNYQVFPFTRKDVDFTEADQLKSLIKRTTPDIIIHSAVSIENFENNIRMYFALEEIASLTKRILIIGSGAEYLSSRYKPLMEETYFPTNSNPPKDIYSLSKYTISRLHQSLKTTNIYNLRVFGIYGPYEDYQRRLISNNIVRHMHGLPLQYNRNISFDYLYITDFLSAIDRFLDLVNPKFNTYNLCIGKAYKFKHIMESIADVLCLPKTSIILNNPEPTTYEYSGNSTLLEKEIGPIEQTSLKEAITHLRDWYAAQDILSLKLN